MSKTQQSRRGNADHLGSPRAITRPSDNQVVWKWDNVDPFGNNAANENPSGLGAFPYNLRHLGQYADAETGTFYNYHRDYDPATGSYRQSDPIGQRGGINLYAYVKGNPLRWADPYGLSPEDVKRIQERIKEIVEDMTKREKRLPDPYKNNLCRKYPWFPGCKNPNEYQDCGEQTETVNDALSKEKFDDRWYFLMDAGFGHAWGVASSSDPKDPLIYYDPRANSVSVGAPCPTCSGWFGGRGYGPSNPPPRPK